MTLLIPFARRVSDQLMVDAEAVQSGKNCGCVCPGCEKPVIARHCTAKVSHFAHVSTAMCEGAFESSLHAAAKQAIVELGFLWLPESLAGRTTKFVFARAEMEKTRDKIRSDLWVYTKGGRPLAVEMFVTHEIGPEKEEYLRTQKLACVEYHLESVPRDITYEELKRMFAEDRIWGTWAYNEKSGEIGKQRAMEAAAIIRAEEDKERAAERKQRAELAAWLGSPHAKAKELPIHRIEEHSYIRACPIARRGMVEDFKGLAFADRDCPKCAYCTGHTETVVKCIGHFPKLALKDDEIVRRFGGNTTTRAPSNGTPPLNHKTSDENPF